MSDSNVTFFYHNSHLTKKNTGFKKRNPGLRKVRGINKPPQKIYFNIKIFKYTTLTVILLFEINLIKKKFAFGGF